MHYLSGGKWKTGLFFKKQLIRKIKINETVFQKVMTVEFWKHPRIWSNIKFRLITDLLSLTKHRHKVLIICCTNSRKNILLFGPRLISVVDVVITPINPYQPIPFHILSFAVFQSRILIYAGSNIYDLWNAPGWLEEFRLLQTSKHSQMCSSSLTDITSSWC